MVAGMGGEALAQTLDTVPSAERPTALPSPSLQLRALIRLIVSNIETHNKHNTLGGHLQFKSIPPSVYRSLSPRVSLSTWTTQAPAAHWDITHPTAK